MHGSGRNWLGTCISAEYGTSSRRVSTALCAPFEREHAQVVLENPFLVLLRAEACVVGEESVVAPAERNPERLLHIGVAKVLDPGFAEQGASRPLDPVPTILVHLPPEGGNALVALGGLLDYERQAGRAAVDGAEVAGVQLEHRNRVRGGLHLCRYFAAPDR